MKKGLLFLLLVALLLLPVLGSAETVEIHEFWMCSPGDVRLPIFPDYSSRIGEGLTKNDFIITYASPSPKVTVEADGTVHIAKGVPLLTNFPLEITYTPKVEGVGEKTVFAGRLRTVEAINEITPEKDFYRIRVGETVNPIVELNGGSTTLVASVTGDNGVTVDKISQWGSDSIRVLMTAQKPGPAKVTVKAYNGTTGTIEFDVIGPPTQFKFAKDHFTGYVGEDIDLGLDTGNGPYGLDYYYSFPRRTYRDGEDMGNAYLNVFTGVFSAPMSGEYRIVCFDGEIKGETRVTVLDRANCESIEVSTGQLYLNREAKIILRDADGAEVYQSTTITKGADLVTRSGRTITVNQPGTVEITVRNPDGTTVSRSFDVQVKPTQMQLNATKLTLDIGETFDLEVKFDQGTDAYSCYYNASRDENYNLYAIRMEGDRIIAQEPGDATIYYSSGNLQAECQVFVRESDKEIVVDRPKGEIGIAQTYQLRILDKAGRAYPATFYQKEEEVYAAALVTASGLMTGNRVGTGFIYAKLEDGRTLYFSQKVAQIPTSLSHPDVELKLNAEDPQLGAPQSDVGPIDMNWIEIKIEDESIATANGNLQLHKAGTTKVTMTAVKGGAQCTFLLTVLPADDAIYIMADGKRYTSHYYSTHIPCDYSIPLPDVTDYYGNKLAVTWKITDESLSPGNPNSTAFRLSGGSLKATWPSGNCKLTATTKDGRTIVMFAFAYRLPDKIKFREDSYTIKVGEHVQTEVEKDENMPSGDIVGDLTWKVGDASIIRFDERFPSTGMPTVTGLKPGTTTLTATQPNGAKAVCTITVVESGRLPGDADNNGAVNMNDALTVLRYCAGEGNAINLSNADVTGDSQVSTQDALLILQREAGWNVTLK